MRPTSDLNVTPMIVMQVGLLRSHGRLLRPISACDRMKLQTFFDAAHLLICCEPRWAGRDMPVGLLIVGRTSRSLSGL
jgi:diadenosine tetraphosphatase ApaH/serine/threonine PP2A family protein phosphatase